KFDRGVTLLLFTRWVVETNDAGQMCRLRGLSFDISRVNEIMERTAALTRPANEADADMLTSIVKSAWTAALQATGQMPADAITTCVSLVNCPEHGDAWSALVATHERRLKGEPAVSVIEAVSES